MSKKRNDGITVDTSAGFADETPRPLARRRKAREVDSYMEGNNRVIRRGDREFVLSRDKDGRHTITCKLCSKSEATSHSTIAGFCDAHDHPELRAPEPVKSFDVEQLIADIRELDELKADGDELEVLSVIVSRLKGGLKVYGKLRIDADERDYEQEALEEAADGMIYSAMGIARRRRRARDGR